MENYQKTKMSSLLYFEKNLREKISAEENEIGLVRKIVFFFHFLCGPDILFCIFFYLMGTAIDPLKAWY